VAIYGVTPEQVAAELPGLFPQGFDVGTLPTAAQVLSYIETADALISMNVQDVTGVAPQLADKAALLAKEYIIARAVARVLAVVYAGRIGAGDVSPAAGYFAASEELRKGILALGEQAVGLGTVGPAIGVSMPADRELLICNADLDGGVNRTRRT
jgi:hypothetical protein